MINSVKSVCYMLCPSPLLFCFLSDISCLLCISTATSSAIIFSVDCCNRLVTRLSPSFFPLLEKSKSTPPPQTKPDRNLQQFLIILGIKFKLSTIHYKALCGEDPAHPRLPHQSASCCFEQTKLVGALGPQPFPQFSDYSFSLNSELGREALPHSTAKVALSHFHTLACHVYVAHELVSSIVL